MTNGGRCNATRRGDGSAPDVECSLDGGHGGYHYDESVGVSFVADGEEAKTE